MSRKATIISIVPFPISEFKPGIYPGFFEIAGSKNEVPEILVVGESVYHVELDENRTITVKCSPDDIAKSLVHDYVISCLAYTVEDSGSLPGIFWKPEELTLSEVTSKYAKDLEQAKRQQRNWFEKLVRLADDDWEKTRQHKFISDMQRYAAKSLKLERPWIISLNAVADTKKCPACQSFVSIEAIICSSCRCILDVKKYESLKFAEVK